MVKILRAAVSGEMGAALAYRGHARSVRDPFERRRLRQIEREEWDHRRRAAAMLSRLGGRPSLLSEVRAWLVGRTLGALCHVTGWFLPMYGAGRVERRNIVEYETAADCARRAGRAEWVLELLEMADVEREHERFFRERIEGHAWTRRLDRLFSSPE